MLQNIQIATFILFLISNIKPSWSQDDLGEFQLHPGCQLELVAKEPHVVDPIAIRFDERGRMWVVEMRDYPTLTSAGATSKIKILEDKNSDGYFETVSVFADRLMFPTGIQPWKKGVIATIEGQVVYLADNDGDNVCDEERVLYRGFAKKNTQLRANHPTLGPDGKIYIANGLRNGEVIGPNSNVSIPITGMDFRFDPVTFECEAVTGYGQFGMTFDEAGHRYTCTNRNPLKRIVIEDKYLKSSAGIGVPQTVVDVAAAGPESRLYPVSKTWTTSNLHANQFTAACGVHIFGGDQLAKEFHGNAFTCDPTANVVHREVISYAEDSVVGSARPGRSKVEFLASTNPEFRPVNLNGGPDGALYVVDMRRTVIEHPQFMPPELKQRPDLRGGTTKGRIYRIRRKQSVQGQGGNKPSDRSGLPVTIVPEIDLYAPLSWKRETSHRLLLQSPQRCDLEKVRKGLARPSSHPNGLIRALSFLQGQNQLRPIDYQFAVSHYSAPVRAFGMKLCESRHSKLLIGGVMDQSDQVRFQALLSLTQSKVDIPIDLLETVAWNSAQNRWVQTSLRLATKDKTSQLLERLLKRLIASTAGQKNRESVLAFCRQLVPLATSQNRAACEKMLDVCLESISKSDLNLEWVALEFLNARQLRPQRIKIRESGESRIEETRTHLRKVIERSEFTEDQIQLLAVLSKNEPFIERMALDASNPERQFKAIRALHFLPTDGPWIELARDFRALPFSLRNEVLRAAYAKSNVAKVLVERVKDKKLSANEIALDARKRLQSHADLDVRNLAKAVFKTNVPADRRKAFEKYQPALELDSNAARGKIVFEKTCATCHQLGELGHRIGPDISDTRTKSKSQLLLDIIRPNAAIDNNFVEYLVGTVDGTTVKGIVVENNSTGITLKQPGGKTLMIARNQIERIQSSGKSLMPVGLEQDLSLQQVADLISYLQNWRYLDQDIPFLEKQNAK